MSSQLNLFEEDDPVVSAEPLYLRGLNAQQQEAVMAPADQPLQVLAGAGTGKTELISRRFIRLVQALRESGIDRPQERILVVTFTNDAALAMRERIHERLLASGEDGLGADAWISTFHQFCMRLLRAHPLEVGLPPDFSTLNALEQQVVFNRLMHGVLAGDYGEISPVLQKFGLRSDLPGDVLSLPELQACALEDVEALLEPGRLYRLVNRIKTAGLSPAEFYAEATRQSRSLTERLKTMPTPHDPDLKSLENVEEKVRAWQDALCDWAHPDWQPVREAERKAETAGKKLTAGMIKDELKGLAKLYLMDRSFEPITPDFTVLDETLALELQTIRLVAAVYALYQDTLLTQGACDFDDLINHSVTLLTRYPALRLRYQKQFEAIIVDEFQDSNGSQLRLLELLVRDQAKNLTVVGDEKQSIYAFRFAQPENLDLIFRHGPYQKVNLQTNYRSRPPILQVANRLTRDLTHKPDQQLRACEAMVAALNTPKVTWVTLDAMLEAGEKPVHPPVDWQKELEARYIAVEVARLVCEKGYRFADMAVLVKSHRKAEAIQKALAALNIPSIRQKNLGFFQEPAIKDAMALLHLLRNPGDDLSLVRILQHKLNHRQLRDLAALKRRLSSDEQTVSLFGACQAVAREPDLIPGFSVEMAQALGDLAEQLIAVRKLKPRLTPVQLFLQLGRRIGLIDPAWPEWQQTQQRIALGTFERLLYLFGQNRPLKPTLDEVIETLEQYAADPGQELPVKDELSGQDAVRIMTVFAAKGLEFPVVFAAYTEKGQTGKTGDDGALIFDPQYAGKTGFGLILGRANGFANLKREIYQKCWFAPRSRTEAQRVFYVALTRAQERLYVIRGSQSFPWTDPDGYPREAVAVISQTKDAETLENRLWNVDAEALRREMGRLQEA